MRASSLGTILFGMVTIPVKFYVAASAASVSFTTVHTKCGGRMKQQMICPADGDEVVEREDMARAFEHARDQFVTFDKEDLERVESPHVGELELLEFVPMHTIDPLTFESAYLIGPDKGGYRAYSLLSRGMTATGKVAIGRHYKKGRDTLVVVRPYQHGLVLHELFFLGEMRDFDEARGEMDPLVDITTEERLTERLITQLARPAFSYAQYADGYAARFAAAVERKVAGKEVALVAPTAREPIVDLAEALKRSLVAGKGGVKKARARGPATDQKLG